MTALLGGCGSLSELSDLDIAQTSGLTALSADENADDREDEGMPLPERNALRAGVKTAEAGQDDSGGFFSLPELPNIEELAAAPAEPARITRWEENPVGVYTVLARQIHSCWLNASSPKLQNHGLHAEVAAGNADEATIIIYQKNEEGRRGLQSFRIEIHGEFSGSSVEAKNRKLDKTQELAFRQDIARWSRGDQQCNI